MNQLSAESRIRIVAALVEGNSIRATCRMTGAAKGTVLKLLADLGALGLETWSNLKLTHYRFFLGDLASTAAGCRLSA